MTYQVNIVEITEAARNIVETREFDNETEARNYAIDTYNDYCADEPENTHHIVVYESAENAILEEYYAHGQEVEAL
jgi:hypothetical protein